MTAVRLTSVAVGVGVAVAVILVVGVPEIAQPVTTCTLGPEVASAWIWTPSILVNVPLGGSAAWGSSQLGWTFISGSLVTGASSPYGGGTALEPGSAEVGINGDVGLGNWSIYRAQNVSSAFGTGSPCGQPYVSEINGGLICGAVGNLSTILPLPDNASDLDQLHSVPPVFPQSCPQAATAGASLWFDTAYHAGATGTPHESETVNLCGPLFTAPLNVSLDSVAEYPVVVTVPVNGGTVHASGYLSWQGPSATPAGLIPTAEYSMPNGWLWNISTIEPGVLPTTFNPSTTSLLAFERSTC
jgi:hypothetical protein